MAQLGFYHWIREGVHRAVLLGVSDAVEQLGVPHEDHDDVGPQLAAVLRPLTQRTQLATAPAVASMPKQERRRLARSLGQIVPPEAKPGHSPQRPT